MSVGEPYMLLHFCPRLFSPFKNVAIIDLQIDPIGIRLAGGIHLATRRPFPNKHFAVACRKEGRKAMNGILIETSMPVEEMHYTARWAVEATFMAVLQLYR